MRTRLLICTLFVTRDGVRLVTDNLQQDFYDKGSVTFLTNLGVANVCQLATDPRAVQSLVNAMRDTTVVHLPGLHAKIYVADSHRVIITSGNLTAGGLFRNIEYGVEVTDDVVIEQIVGDITQFAELGTLIPRVLLSQYCDTVEELYSSIRDAKRNAQSAIRERFRQSLVPVEDELIRLRLSGGPVHTVFAKTIEYLLRSHGPLSTVRLHPLVSTIHPDLCDNSVDRIIDGERFGKKWKHAVRTAQQQLKKQGKVLYVNGTWRINSDV